MWLSSQLRSWFWDDGRAWVKQGYPLAHWPGFPFAEQLLESMDQGIRSLFRALDWKPYEFPHKQAVLVKNCEARLCSPLRGFTNKTLWLRSYVIRPCVQVALAALKKGHQRHSLFSTSPDYSSTHSFFLERAYCIRRKSRTETGNDTAEKRHWSGVSCALHREIRNSALFPRRRSRSFLFSRNTFFIWTFTSILLWVYVSGRMSFTSIARVYANVNRDAPKSYWDYGTTPRTLS